MTSNALTDRDANKVVTLSEIGTKIGLDVNNLNSLVPEKYDYISLGYTGSDLTTVTYKLGGSNGTTVATLTLAYNSGNLVSVTRA